MQLGSRELGLAQRESASSVDAVQGKDVLGEIDSNVQNGHELLLPSELDESTALPILALVAGIRLAAGSGRGSPFHSLDPTLSTELDSGNPWEAQMKFNLECEREDDGRWLAEVSQLPGVLAYGGSANEAMAKAEVLALRVLAEQLESGEVLPLEISISLPAAA